MSLWNNSTSSERWADDVAMASVSKGHCDIQSPDESGTKSFDLPLPVTHIPPNKEPVTVVERIRALDITRTAGSTFRRIKKTLAAPSTKSAVRKSLGDIGAVEEANEPSVVLATDDDIVDETVVDRSWNEPSTKSIKSKALSESDDGSTTHISVPDTEYSESYTKHSTPVLVIKRLHSFTQTLLNPRFKDDHKEDTYLKEHWLVSKRLALWSSIFFILNWILAASLIPTPAVLADKIYYYGVSPLTAIPLLLLCALNAPRNHSKLYQCFLFISTWQWSFYQVLFGYLCGYSGEDSLFTCGSKDFSSTFYYTTALQTIALFGMNLKRFPALLGAIIFLILSGVLIIPEKVSWMRNAVNFAVFQVFILYMHYQREMAARHLFELRIELKEQFEHTQRAQINEREAADSKYRLTSYVFHDELTDFPRYNSNLSLNNTGPSATKHCTFLAVQNMSASGTIAKSLDLEFNALEGSLSMMSKVLNDVLDFNRMDSGKFESLSRPYAFHQVMRSMFLPLRLATNARELELVTDLDMNIDEIARRATYEALGEDAETINRHLKEQPSGESFHGIVAGDETRLRQVVTNLASNACKFTPAGGKVTIRTQLVHPSVSSRHECIKANDQENKEKEPQRSTNSLTLDNVEEHDAECGTERIVVRIEVSDSGSGIRPQDMAQSKLFSAFNQTEQGRRQGGKGTGLGLALVRLIVELSGGRLGVISKVSQGSTFWVELPLGVGVKAMRAAEDTNILSSPGRNFSSNTLAQLFKNRNRRDSTGSKPSIVDAVDAASQRAMQNSPVSLRSSSALHRLMDQGGSVELNLANYDSHTPVPTRTIGDRSTGTEVPLPYLTREESRLSDLRHGADQESVSTSSSDANSQRPTYVRVPSPQILDTPHGHAPASSISLLPQSTHLPPSPLANRAFPPPSPLAPMFEQVLSALVVDDDALTRTLMKRMLERLGCEVTTAENGDVALKILLSQDSSDGQSGESTSITEHRVHQYKFSIIFLDNQMPVLSGLKLIAKLRELGRRDFVVGVTGNALVTDQKEYLDAGVDHVLTKPVLERSLRAMLQTADDRRKIHRDGQPSC